MTANDEEDQQAENAAKKDADTENKVGSYQNRVKRQAHKKAQNFIREKLHQKNSIPMITSLTNNINV